MRLRPGKVILLLSSSTVIEHLERLAGQGDAKDGSSSNKILHSSSSFQNKAKLNHCSRMLKTF